MRKSVKYFNVIIDNPVFVMHYGATAFLLILFSLLVSLHPKNESVSCFPKDDIPPKFLEAFCWMHPIYAKDNSTLKTDSGINSPMPRFAQKQIWYDDDAWISLLFLLLASAFCMPRFFWKYKESGKVQELLSLLRDTSRSSQENIMQMTDNILQDPDPNESYFVHYFIAEIFNAMISTLGIVLVKMFLDGESFPQRAEVFEFVNKDWSLCWMSHCKSTSNILEKLNKCIVHRFTSSGNVESLEAIIVLPTSMIHEKIYIFLWYWFFMMRVLSYAVLVYRLFLCVVPCFRLKVLKLRCENSNILDLGLITDVLSIDDWFLIYLLSKNMDPETFSDLMTTLTTELRYEINDPE
ncbi:innexin inx2 [Caerostris darwini]|uniref:Innexin n=1 Tax=Caerostris darwini TaxID=1538125 RepID=A0AAV4R1C2_9ARAC|nr:innexin inx2 [Caerostris darwini]